ncbi:MAG: ABC transporter permease, partial [Ferruginibacter sp.]
MNKIGLIIEREYFTRVKKKSFLITTILVPVVIIGFYAAIIAIAVKGGTDKQTVAVIDDASLFNGKVDGLDKSIELKFMQGETEAGFVSKYKEKGYDAFLYIPTVNIDSPKNLRLHTQSSPSLSTTSALEDAINKAIQNKRLLAQGIDPQKYQNIAANIKLRNI